MAITVTTPLTLTPEGPYNTGDVVEISGEASSQTTFEAPSWNEWDIGAVTYYGVNGMTVNATSPVNSKKVWYKERSTKMNATLSVVYQNSGRTDESFHAGVLAYGTGTTTSGSNYVRIQCDSVTNLRFYGTDGGGDAYSHTLLPLKVLADDYVYLTVKISGTDIVVDTRVTTSTGVERGASSVAMNDVFKVGEPWAPLGYTTPGVVYYRDIQWDGLIGYSTERNSVEISTDNPNSVTMGTTAQFGDTVEMFASDDNWVTRTSLGSAVLEEAANGKEWDFGGGALSVVAGIGYTATLDLAMMKAVDSTGIVSWVDMLQAHDRWSTKFSVEVSRSNAEAFEHGLKGQYTDGVTLTSISGFYPFSSYFNYSGGVAVALSNMPTPKEVNLYGDAVQYTVEAIPAYTDNLYPNVPASGARARCGNVPADWTLDTGVDLPYPENGFPASLNVDNSAQQTNGGYSSVFHVERTAGEIVKIKVETDEEGARQLVNLFITNRGENMDSYFPDAYSPFAHIYEGKTYFTTRLASELVEFEYANHRHVRVTFSIQCIEAVS